MNVCVCSHCGAIEQVQSVKPGHLYVLEIPDDHSQASMDRLVRELGGAVHGFPAEDHPALILTLKSLHPKVR